MISRKIVRVPKLPIRRAGRTAAILAAAGALAVSLAAAHAASASDARHASGFHFTMVRTPGVTCLPNAHADVTIVRGAQNDTMTISVRGLPKGTYRVSITAKTSDGRSVSDARTYHTCASRRSARSA